jgi:hypothetical protein
MIKLFQIILLSTVITACVPVLKKDYYLSFEKVAGVNSVKVLDNIPVEYRLNRNDYIIRLRLDEKSGLRLYINSEDMNAIPLAINAKPVGGVSEDSRCGLFSEPYPKDDIFEQGVVVFSWYITRTGCGIDELKDRELTLNFVVMGKNNQALGVENIPFEVKKKGLRVVFDAI